MLTWLWQSRNMAILRSMHIASRPLTHWGRVTHICVGKLTINGSDNGLSPGRRQAIIWTNAVIFLIGPLGTNFNEILIKIITCSFMKMPLKMSSAKWRPFCLGLYMLHYTGVIIGAIASQITSLAIVHSTVYSDADQRKHQSSASLAFVWGIHRGPVNSPHKWPVTRKMLPFDDVIMKQAIFDRAVEVGDPPVSLSLVGTSSHSNNALYYGSVCMQTVTWFSHVAFSTRCIAQKATVPL